MTWAFKRQIFYTVVLLIFFSVIGFLIAYPYINKAPTCFDNKQNGIETGVDCGGACLRACIADVDKMSILWARVFRVVPGRYNAVAYLDNKNNNAAIHKIKYRFRFADKDNLFIGKREGETFVPAFGKFAIFEPAIDFGNSIPVYTTLEFTEAPAWVQVPQQKVSEVKVFTRDVKLEDETTSPRLSAFVKNNSLYTIPEMSVVAILYDEKGNAISASRTYIDILNGEEEKGVTFTWPEPIEGRVIAKEIIPMFDIFLAKQK
jgi:hypothetical protein